MPDRRHKTQSASPFPDKTCASCGRSFAWRKKWARDWDEVRFCSDACRSRVTDPRAAALEAAILTLLAARGRDKTICPSEAAKLVGSAATDIAPAQAEQGWQSLMEPARAAARRLVASGRIVITQQGHVVDPSTAKGPIRLKLR